METKTSNEKHLINYEIGNAFRGQTHLWINEQGNFELTSNVSLNREQLSFKGTLPQPQLDTLLNSIKNTEYWSIKHTEGHPINDDVKITIQFSDGTTSYSAYAWASEMGKQDSFNSAQSIILELISLLSDGKILENGR